MTGLLIAVEGPKAVGKSTLIRQLQQLTGADPAWLFTKEPTDEFDPDNEAQCSGIELAALIAEDRRRHLADVIQPALKQEQIVVTDRYVLSSFAFHCLDGVMPQEIRRLNAQFPRPDILLILQCSPQTIRKRRMNIATPTRLSSSISVEAETIAYVEYAKECAPDSEFVSFRYNETMRDCDTSAKSLVADIAAMRARS
jgi:dTMP kinase